MRGSVTDRKNSSLLNGWMSTPSAISAAIWVMRGPRAPTQMGGGSQASEGGMKVGVMSVCV